MNVCRTQETSASFALPDSPVPHAQPAFVACMLKPCIDITSLSVSAGARQSLGRCSRCDGNELKTEWRSTKTEYACAVIRFTMISWNIITFVKWNVIDHEGWTV